jgi:hypothetical protein
MNPAKSFLGNSFAGHATTNTCFWAERLLRNAQEITAAFPAPSPNPLPRGGEGFAEVISWAFLRLPASLGRTMDAVFLNTLRLGDEVRQAVFEDEDLGNA